MAAADRAQLIAELVLDDKFTRPLNRIDKRMGAFSGAVNRNLGRGIDTAVTKIGRAVVDIGQGVTTAAIDWQDAFQGVVKTVDATPAQFDEIAASIRNMATEMPVAATELAAIAESGGAMGIAAEDIEAFTKQVAILSSTTDLTSEQAANGLGQLQNTIGLTRDEFDEFSDTLVLLGNEGSSFESTILELTRRMGAVGKSFGLSKDQILGWAAAAANMGMTAEEGGGALQGMLQKLQPAVFKGSKPLQEVFGKSGKAIRKMFEKDAGGALRKFVKRLAAMPKDARLGAIETLFGRDRGIRRFLTGAIEELPKFEKALDDANKGWFDSAAAQEEFEKRNATVRSSITRLRNGITEAAITVGEGFVPALGRAADKLSAFLKVPANRDALKRIGEDIGRIIDGIDWNALIGYAKDFMGALDKASGFAKSLWDAFSAIPSDAKAVLLSLAGLNKLSGGAVTGIVGDAFKGIGDQFFARGSSPANPMFVSGTGTGGTPTPGGSLTDLIKFGLVASVGAAVLAGMAELQRGMTASLSTVLANGNRDLETKLKTVFDIGGSVVNPIGQMILDLGKNLEALQHLDRIPGELETIAAAIGLINKPKPTGPGMIPGPPGGGRGLPNRPGGPGGGARSAEELKRAIAGTKSATQDVGTKVGKAQGVLDKDILAARDAIHQGKTATVTAVGMGALGTSIAARGAGAAVTNQSVTNTNRMVSAFHSIPAPIVNVDVDISAMSVTRQTTTVTRSLRPSSRTADDYGGGP